VVPRGPVLCAPMYRHCDCCYVKGPVGVRCNCGDGDYVLDEEKLEWRGKGKNGESMPTLINLAGVEQTAPSVFKYVGQTLA
jgi:hypothetical protein